MCVIKESVISVNTSSDDAVISGNRVEKLLLHFEQALLRVMGSHLESNQVLGDIYRSDQDEVSE